MNQFQIIILVTAIVGLYSCKDPCPPKHATQFVPLDSIYKSLAINQGNDTLVFTYNSLDTVVFYPERHDSGLFEYDDTYPHEQCGYVGDWYTGEMHSYFYSSPIYRNKLVFVSYMDLNGPRIVSYMGYYSWGFDTKYVPFNKPVTVNGHLFLNTYKSGTFIYDLYEGIVSFQTGDILWERLLK